MPVYIRANDTISQSVTTWFQNEARKIFQGDDIAPATQKRDKRSHPASDKAWTPRSVCGSIFSDRVAHKQREIAEGGGKGIETYSPALKEVFGTLTPEEKEQCERLCKEWNNAAPSEDVQRK